MKVKNISGGRLTFKVGKRTHTIDSAATQTVDDSIETINDVIDHVHKGRLEIVGPPPVAQYGGTPERYGYAALNLQADLVNADTVTIAGATFEFDADAAGSPTVTGTNIPVLLSANWTDMANALKTAINANATLSALGLVADDVLTAAADSSYVILKAKGDLAIADVTITQAGDGIGITKVNAQEGAGHRIAHVVHVQPDATSALIDTGLESIVDFWYQIRLTKGGALHTYNGVPVIGGGFIYFPADADPAALAENNVITITAIGK